MATDRISNLPDDVLGKILSLVPTKLAASTAVLSKRKDGEEEPTSIESRRQSRRRRRPRFSDFVDKTLDLLSNSTIKKFSLRCNYENDISRVNSWIRTALGRGCVELNLKSNLRNFIDSEFFTSNTLVKLTITDKFCLKGRLPLGGVFFPALKTLTLVSVYFLSHEMEKHFVRGCPALEELFIYVWMGYLSTPYVKRLTITSDFADHYEYSGLTLKTKSLLYLDYSSYVATYDVVALDSLVEARLDLRLYGLDADGRPVFKEIRGDISTLINGMKNIKSLHLSAHSLQVFHFCCDSMPVLNNLLTLSIESDEEKGWEVIPRLLCNSPNLQTLVIKGLVHRVTEWCGNACPCIIQNEMVCCLSSCQVKVLEITGFRGSLGELHQMRHFLGNLECLETVKVGVEESTFNSKYLRAILMAIPRVSSKCSIQFI
ncbi:F-box protein At4g27050 isoform X2 [Eutrema salsugineum]|uniref:F-box protein At4g27050 isoform X2 n=1 Tax=Eutrema salsugineum TaxID=72664 RepID=UPI000CECEE2F|nr:F-box protein At4g27050 isoform X2 [Eutrema salsugineum]